MSHWLLFPVLVMSATAYNATFERATAAYEAGNDETAVRLYEQLIAEGVVDASIFYNLGNTYYRAGRLGPAIANYERALQQDPAFENARHNLAQSLEKTRRKLGRPAAPAWHHRLLPLGSGVAPRAAIGLALFFWFFGWILLGVRLLVPLRYLRRAAVLAELLAVAFGVTAWVQAHPPLFAVVSEEHVSARLEPNEKNRVHHSIYEGDRVLVQHRTRGWAQVSTANGETGWIPERSLAFVGPPYLRPPDTAETGNGSEGAT